MKKEFTNNFKRYYQLTKPGIVYGNAVSAIGGFLLASRGDVSVITFLAMLFGTCFVIASSCVFNNYLDRNIDRKMKRTQNRALVIGSISTLNAIIFGVCLSIIGIVILFLFTNTLTLLIGLIGVFAYVVLYGYFKRSSVHGTLIGSIAGAIPPVTGYTAVTNTIDTAAILLFAVLVVWQMPHFYAIAIMGMKGYKEAGIPVLAVKKGIPATKLQILLYTIAFLPTTLLLSVLGYTGLTYTLLMGLLGSWWILKGIKGYRSDNDLVWAKGMFRFSLIILISFCLLISLDVVLP